MRRTMIAFAACSLLTASTMVAQSQRPVYYYRGYGPYTAAQAWHAGTVQATLARQRANMIRAQGVYNALTAQAMISQMEAQRRHIKNRVASVRAHFEMKDINRQARFGTPSKGARRAALVRRRREERAKHEAETGHSTSLSHFPRGKITWPTALRAPEFTEYRKVVEQLVAQRYAAEALSDNENKRLRQVITAMVCELRNQVEDCSPQEYVNAKLMLKRLTG